MASLTGPAAPSRTNERMIQTLSDCACHDKLKGWGDPENDPTGEAAEGEAGTDDIGTPGGDYGGGAEAGSLY